MFTGIVLGQGEVTGLEPIQGGGEMRIRLRPLFKLEQIIIGESIAVNGACLTVESALDDGFCAYASAQTLAHTNLGTLRNGAKVNLERALALGDRLGGHMVSGHVDTTAEVKSVAPSGQSWACRLAFDQQWGREVIERGSVALDGMSLTITRCGRDFLEVNVIPETARVTTVSQWRPGWLVNMETDLVGKYIRRQLEPWQDQASSRISENFLRENGFLG